ncbi:MAG: AIPR family protein [Patescibacteria group bacterium]|nr:AIPR family protein [Patescibacteria group bacterium]
MAKATIVRFPVFSFRKQPTPYDESGKQKYYAVVNVKDVPAELEEWRELNVRDPKEEIRVPKEIKDSLRDDPASFYFKNRGILLVTDKVTFDNKTNVVALEFTDKGMNGIADGGHTYRVIQNHVAPLSPEERDQVGAFVSVEFLEGFKTREDVVPVIEARNKSTPVQEQSIQELLGSYQKIKEVLKNKPYASRIFYKQYEEPVDGVTKDIDIKEILSYLYCFDVETFDNKTHPIKAYSSRGAVVGHFADEKNKNRLEKYIPLLPEILELRDRIYANMPGMYNTNKGNGSGGKFGNLKGVDKIERGSKEELVFIGEESDYRIPQGFIYPVLASLRNLVDCDGQKCNWKTDPFQFLTEAEGQLVALVGSQALSIKNPNALGKDSGTWTLCYQYVENTVLRRHL